MEREKYIDSLKGIGIILVVLGHSLEASCGSLRAVINAFHIPLFFFAAGLLAHYAYNQNFSQFCFKRLKAYVPWQLLMGCTYALASTVFPLIQAHTVSNISWHGFGIWYLYTYFYTCVVFFCVTRICNLSRIRNQLIVGALILAAATASAISGYESPTHLEQTPVALLFFFVGSVVRFYDIPSRIGTALNKCWLFALPLLVVIALNNDMVRMFANHYGNVSLFYAGAFLGIFISLYLARLTVNDCVIQLFGRFSIVVYATHFCLMNLVQPSVYQLVKLAPSFSGVPAVFLNFLLVMLAELLLLLAWRAYKNRAASAKGIADK